MGRIARAECIKKQQLMEIQKQKSSTLEEVSQLEDKFAASVSFSFLYCIF